MTYSLSYNHSDDFNFNSDDDSLQTFPHFQSGEIANELEMVIMDILEMVLGDRFRYCPQVPLEAICSRPETFYRLPDDLWKFWVSSRVDIAAIERGYRATRKAKLVVECQSQYHDSLDAQVRDRKKAGLLASVGVPLVYVRRVDEDRRFYRFYTPNNREEVIYNLITQQGRNELETFLQRLL
ncbi:DUF2726 domain-containing protein [Planktothrix sp. FACHB-1355]|uniref:DUF2726 domain-containing protein n=1 Tax=Aerosakkonema funiforme FACHB-1375 TaxID=2949571 RepID=A0A926ZIN4_9CYAN|nr:MULTISPECIES: DUF2726 domain-containing protein [Oscillatoriales]MBD2183472.1 DUF2726 domain-containing protein [Aerosakkonema funiforme FACHB-1375]MBD3562464.1 DUF2726 domain-containing protein [Planktothrix sp. FACHB-1355]